MNNKNIANGFASEIDAFDDHIRWEAGLTRRSRDKALYAIQEWQRWLNEQGKDWRQAGADLAATFICSQNERWSRSTVQRKFWAMRKLYAWAQEQGLVKRNPFSDVRGPQTGQRFIAYVPSIPAMDRLLEQPNIHTHRGIRDRAAMELLFGAGIRAQELLHLRLGDLHLKDRYAIVKGKGGQQRLVVFGDAAQEWMRRYLEIRSFIPIDTGSASSWGSQQVFVHHRGPMNYDMLRSLVSVYARRAGFPLITAHSLRHAFATHMYQRGANLRVIQEMLGHACLQTTTIYAHALTNHMHDLLAIHHPRGELYDPKKRSPK